MRYPALTVQGVDADFLLASIDDDAPTAIDTVEAGVIVFFNDPRRRDSARATIGRDWPAAVVTSIEVDDEDWARRSQENLAPVVVGRLTILPAPPAPPAPPALPAVVIRPSTGFGTGHHATTRLCLAALQSLDVRDGVVLDLGTGSGILAIAASVLGARHVVGVDDDPDAVRAALENVALNAAASGVSIVLGDLTSTRLPLADVVTANLTGALLQRAAGLLLNLLRDGGHLILSGVLVEEGAAMHHAFQGAELVSEMTEDGWVGMVYRRPSVSPAPHPRGTAGH